MLILEIVLTVVAWKRGWKALALLPLVAAVVIGFCIGLAGEPQLGFIADIIAIIALIVMCCIRRGEAAAAAAGAATAPSFVPPAEDTGAARHPEPVGAAGHEYYVFKNNEQMGPYSISQLRGMITRNEIDPTDLGWKQGLADWQPLNQISELNL